MKLNFETYDDGEIDLLLEPEHMADKVLLAALAHRAVDNLGVDSGGACNMTIRFKTEWND